MDKQQIFNDDGAYVAPTYARFKVAFVRGEGSRLHLTEKGRAVAEDCAPARRLIGRMFSEKLGLSAARADREALAVLGALEEDTVKRIARLGRGKERE